MTEATASAATPPGSGSDPLDHAAHSIAVGSKSFAAAARLFDPATRRSVLLLYAWCRHCDDVVDGQSGGFAAGPPDDLPAVRLARLETATRQALAGRPAADPVFRGLAEVADRHRIPVSEPLVHLEGFRMDVEGRRYENLEDLAVYCHGVAGVVGLMMARIMGVDDRDTLDRAVDLGIAFQLTNIARDVIEDAGNGRVYLPLAWLSEAGVPADALADPAHRPTVAGVAARLVEAAEPYYRSALVGIGRLPPRSAAAVATARGVYRAIGRKVVRAGSRAWDGRIATSRAEKLGHVAAGLVTALAARPLARRPRDPALWTPPR